MQETLVVNEIYLSIQGESSWAGMPCVFIRLTGCDLRCSYCDSAFAFSAGEKMALDSIIGRVEALAANFCNASPKLPLVELTGGEPLLQSKSGPLMARLCDRGYIVLLETSGAHDIAAVDPRVRRIMDLKCPSSGESRRNQFENLAALTARDEVKFVIATLEDYHWAKETTLRHELSGRCPVLFSWAAPLAPSQRDASLKTAPPGTPISRQELAERMIADAVPARFQLQMHKFIWPPDARGV